MVLEGRQESLVRDLLNTEKKLEKLFELGSLVPGEVQAIMKVPLFPTFTCRGTDSESHSA